MPPLALVVIVVVPYGPTKSYEVFGQRPPVTEIRMRPNVICSPGTGPALTNAPSTPVRMNARPAGPPLHPGVVMLSEVARS
jgi:hypothetical protein